MLEHLPHWLGQSLASVRAGSDKLVIARLGLADAAPLHLSSPAFADGARLHARFTADADDAGVSPPLVWNGEPEGTLSLVLVVEDPDAPASEPFVHALLFDIAPATHALGEGAIGADDADAALGETGRNSYLGAGWLPPDPPTGTARIITFSNCSRSIRRSTSPATRADRHWSRRSTAMCSPPEC